MIKYVCDMCSKPLLDSEDVRYVVRIDVYPAYEPSEYPEEFDDRDVADEMFEGADDPDALPPDDDSCASFRFDLCPTCHKRYLDDPLFTARKRRIDFSDN